MKIGSLFSGIGGFDLAARWMGWETKWYSEIDPYACRVMKNHFPEARNVGDATAWRPDRDDAVDLVCGGFPCQPVSLAGKGLAQEDERWLWPEFARVLGILRPRYVVVENVPGLCHRGMGDVLGDLATLGYDAEWESIPASAVGAPHLRDRVWIVANANGEHGYDGGHGAGSVRGRRPAQADVRRGEANVADANGEIGSTTSRRSNTRSNGRNDPQGRGAKSGGRMADPNSEQTDRPSVAWAQRNSWNIEPNVGRVAHGVPARVDRLRCLGNAIVPQIAYCLFQQIEASR